MVSNFQHSKVYAKFLVHYLFFGRSKILFMQVHYSHLLVPGQVSNIAISTPLRHVCRCLRGVEIAIFDTCPGGSPEPSLLAYAKYGCR